MNAQEQAIPHGFRVYESDLEVAGVAYRKRDALAFVNSKRKWLAFERDPRNPHDKNAIRVIGCSKGLLGVKRRHIGFVPSDVAETMVKAGVDSAIEPRLHNVHVGRNGFIEILFQIIGPKRGLPEPKSSASAEDPHYTDFVDRVRELKANKRHNEAIELLQNLVAQTEQEAAEEGLGVAPWYYEQLAILFRKEKRYGDEVAILERYQAQPKAPGVTPAKLAERLVKARQIRDRASS